MADEIKKGAEGGVSPTPNGEDSPTPGSNKKGAIPSQENLIAENKRLHEKLSKLEKTQEDLLVEMDEIRSSFNGSNGNGANGESNPIVSAIKDPKNKLAVDLVTHLVKELVPNMIKDSSWQDRLEVAKDMITEKANELGIDPTEFAKVLKKYAVDYNDKTPDKKYSLAIRDYLKAEEKSKKDQERLAKLKELEDQEGTLLPPSRKVSTKDNDKFQRVKEAGSERDLMAALSDLT